MDTSAIEKDFEEAVNNAIQKMKSAGYTPRYLEKSIKNNGTLSAVKKILDKAEPPSGFTNLQQKGYLEFTLELLVLHPAWRDLFTYSEQETAHKRIENALQEAAAQ